MTERKPPFDEDRMTREEAAAYIGVSPFTMRNWASTGEKIIPYYRPGRQVYYRKTDLDAWLETRRRNHAG